MRLKATEHDEQVAVVYWCRLKGIRIYKNANEAKRSFALARWLKAEGLEPGVLDLFVPYARRGKHGLYVEMKSETGKLSEAQKDWIRFLTDEGYEVVVCYSREDAIEYIIRYMGTKEGQ